MIQSYSIRSILVLLLFVVLCCPLSIFFSGARAGFTENTPPKDHVLNSSAISNTSQELQTSDPLDIEKRVLLLESSKQDLTIWISILLAITTMVVAINIGISVWQVSNIAKKEVDQIIKDYDVRFAGFLSEGLAGIILQTDKTWTLKT